MTQDYSIEIPTASEIEGVKKISGALSVSESIAIFNVSKQSPKGVYLELGSHKGKSGASALLGLTDGQFIAVDPIFEESKILLEVANTLTKFADDSVDIQMTIGLSENVIPKHDNLAYVFLDTGSHGDGLPMREVQLLEDKIKQGGILCFHDYKNQFVEVEAAYNYLLSTGKYEVVPIDWPAILKYVTENNLEEGNNSWHQYPDLGHPPNFVGALRRK